MSLGNSPAELEVRRIARLLRIEAHLLADLVAVGVEDLRTLRDQITARLFDAHAESWERAVAVAGVVPTGLAAKLAERALGPVLAARVTGATPPQRAVDIGRRLSPEFLADIAVNLDPRKVTETISAMPPDTIAAVSRVLEQRGEWLVMADFVAAVSPESLAETVDVLTERAILQVTVLLEDPVRIAQVVELLDEGRIEAVRRTAAAEGLEAHLAHLADAVEEPHRARLRAA
ncbi:hypothetical protein [Euzebya sp.]|uniref:hypothetical protein n=1 Tax=Euzebya sp. TaxID=1971409 RepID=UPI003516B596